MNFTEPIFGSSNPVITRATVDLAQMAQDLGAHSVMVTPTKEAFPQSDAQLFDYFAAVQDGCTLPIVLQDHPASTGVFMSAELLVQIFGLKLVLVHKPQVQLHLISLARTSDLILLFLLMPTLPSFVMVLLTERLNLRSLSDASYSNTIQYY